MLSRFNVPGNVELQTETIEYAGDDVASADINIEFGSFGSDLYALEDSRKLIEGTVSYTGELVFETSTSGNQASISLDTRSADNDWTFFIDPSNWASNIEGDRWQIGLNPDVDTDLRLDVGSGSVDLDLSALSLMELHLEGGSGSTELFLLDGDYDVFCDARSGSMRMTMPGSGNQTIEIEGGSGSLTLYIPDSMEAQVEVQGGSGSFRLHGGRFHQVRGDERDEGVWETAGYDDASDKVDLFIDVGSGSVDIRDS